MPLCCSLLRQPVSVENPGDVLLGDPEVSLGCAP